MRGRSNSCGPWRSRSLAHSSAPARGLDARRKRRVLVFAMAIIDFDRSEENVWRPRAAAIIPGGASTGSKRPEALFGDRVGELPTHFARARGCRVETAEGRELIDCTMALGAVAIGYGDDVVTQAVVEAAVNGTVCGLSPALEIDVAERLAG